PGAAGPGGAKPRAAGAHWGRDAPPWLGLLGCRTRAAAGRSRRPCVGERSAALAALGGAAVERARTAWPQAGGTGGVGASGGKRRGGAPAGGRPRAPPPAARRRPGRRPPPPRGPGGPPPAPAPPPPP